MMQPRIFEQQVVPKRDKMFRFALRLMGNQEDARDIVQDAFLKIWNQQRQLYEVENMEAWCMRIVKNLCLDSLKAGKVRKEAIKSVQMNQSDDYTANPYQQAEKEDNMNRIKRLIDELPEKFQMIIHLRDIEEFSYKEIMEMMELSLDEVKVNLFRARKMLKDKLIKNHGYGLS
jgi:RNA polymerase sigma-70 factor (ECF subfamily)